MLCPGHPPVETSKIVSESVQVSDRMSAACERERENVCIVVVQSPVVDTFTAAHCCCCCTGSTLHPARKIMTLG